MGYLARVCNDVKMLGAQMVLLGAGASVDAGVPTSIGLTRRIAESIEVDRFAEDESRALHVAITSIAAHDTSIGGRAFDGIDVERLFSAIQMLSNRVTLEVTPFVATWNSAIYGIGAERPFPAPLREWFAEDLLGPHGTNERFNSRFQMAVESVVGADRSEEVFRSLEVKMIDSLRHILRTEEGAGDYLAPLLNLGDGPARIATLNYDTTIEDMATRWGRTLTTGIEQWAGGLSWEWGGSHDVQLLKLHGSMNWYESKRYPGEGRLLERKITVGTGHPSRVQATSLGLVFGQRGKLRADGPFLAMLNGLEEMLRETHHLYVVGYSFRDAHINEAIRSWFNSTLDRQLTIIDPSFEDLDEHPIRREVSFRSELLDHILMPSEYGRIDAKPPHAIVAQGAADALEDVFGSAPERR